MPRTGGLSPRAAPIVTSVAVCLVVGLLVVAACAPGADAAGAAPSPALPSAAARATAPYLILHLDGVSSEVFFSELRAGRLPSIKAAFAGGVEIEHALSLFVGGTAMIYPRLKTGLGSEAPYPVCLLAYDRASGRVIGELEVARSLLSSIPGISRGQWLYGAPGLEAVAGLALLNTPRLLRDHDVVEFLWFATDGSAHLFGEEAQRRSIRLFDRYLGLILGELASTPVNLVLYADHGMSFPNVKVELDTAVRRTLADAAQFYAYPNVYLKEPRQAGAVARALSGLPEVDFAFYRAGERAVAGWHKGGRVLFEETESGLRFSCEGPDPFGYAELGYDGRPLSDDEWLRVTATSRFPAVPANIYRYMSNRLAGDVVIVTNPPNLPRFTVTRHGCHAGITSTDLLVPVLLKGPDISAGTTADPFWLHTLYREVLGLDPLEAARRRSREDFSLRLGAGPGPALASLSLSPGTGWNVVAMNLPEGWSWFGEREVFRGFLGRLWVGLGVGEIEEGRGLAPLLTTRLQVFARRLSLEFVELSSMDNRCSLARASWELRPGVTLDWTFPATAGISLYW